MFSDPFFLEKYLRWFFSIALLLALGFTFYDSELYRLLSIRLAGAPTTISRCQFQMSRNPEHTAGLGFPQLESLARHARNLKQGERYALEACRHDPSLSAVYIRQLCGNIDQLHHMVPCK